MKIAVFFIFCVAATLAVPAPRESGEAETDPNNKEPGPDFEKPETNQNQREGRNENVDKSGKITAQPDKNELSGQNSGAGNPGAQNGRSPQSNFGTRGHSQPQGVVFPGEPATGQQGNGRNPGQGPQSGQSESGSFGRGQNGRPNSGPGGSQFGQSENNSGGRGQNGRPNAGPGGPQENGKFGPGQGQPNPGQQGWSKFTTNSGFTTTNPFDKEEITDEPPKTGVTYVGGNGIDGGQTGVDQSGGSQIGGGAQTGASTGTESPGGGVNGLTTRSPGFFDRLTGAFKKIGK